ncbi:MAG: asparagine synthase-related protein [Gammaproteobacteria bacterium]|nr:asparagine synthase-related protein [Gammaproteobacteria bacterium]
MGSICGWSGMGLGPDMSQQTITAMLKACGETDNNKSDSDYDGASALGISKGLYATSHFHQDGIRAAIVGSPTWDDRELSDTATKQGAGAALIKAYRAFGKDLLSRLHGPFALAITDDRQALVAIDRIGIHSLSYALHEGMFVFSTSIGSVVKHPNISRNIDPQAIFNYIYFYDIPSPGTIFTGVEKLQPAQYVQFRDGQLEKGFYWKLHFDEHNQASFQTQKQQFHDLLRHAVATSSRGNSIATFLSGGTDSSTITGVLAELQENPVDSYSIGFGAEGFDEMEYARLAAQRFGATAHEYYLKPDDVLEAIPLIASTYDEPFANESAVPTYFCARQAARDGVKIMLAGDGGDEIFGGNERYAKQMVFEHYGRLPDTLRNYLIEPLANGIPGGDALLPTRKLKSYIRQASVPLPERMESYNFIYRQPLDEMFEPEFLASVNPEIPKEMLQDAYFRADSGHPINRMLHLDMKFTLADNDLRKVSRMCEVAGIEVRYPLLDEALVNFSGQLPINYKIRGQRLRWFFKEALKDLLPRKIITKSKHGFGLPFGVWALSHPPISELVDDSLKKFEGRGFLKTEYIKNIRQQHASEHSTYFGKMIWVMLMLEQWLEVHDTD